MIIKLTSIEYTSMTKYMLTCMVGYMGCLGEWLLAFSVPAFRPSHAYLNLSSPDRGCSVITIYGFVCIAPAML